MLKGQPENFGQPIADQDCAMFLNQQWHDEFCEHFNAVICEQ